MINWASNWWLAIASCLSWVMGRRSSHCVTDSCCSEELGMHAWIVSPSALVIWSWQRWYSLLSSFIKKHIKVFIYFIWIFIQLVPLICLILVLFGLLPQVSGCRVANDFGIWVLLFERKVQYRDKLVNEPYRICELRISKLLLATQVLYRLFLFY